MKRLFAIIGFTYLIILTVASFLSEKILVVCLGVNVIAFIVCMFVREVRKNKVFPVALFTSILGMFIYLLNYHQNIFPMESLYDKDLNISGIICDIPYCNNGRYYYTVEVDKVEGTENLKKFKMSLSTSNAIESDIYDRITVNVHTFDVNSGKGFYSKQYSMSRKIYISGYVYDYQPIEVETNDSKPLNYYILKIRVKLISSMKSMMPELPASIVNGILLGEKYDIPNNIKDNFIRVGIYQILAVSGIHLVIVSRILFLCFNKIGLRKSVATVFTIAFILLFMSINCFTPSILRAGIMLIIYLIGGIIGRQSDSINSLGLSVFLISLVNPNIGGDIRIWMSCLSVLGIIVFERKIQNLFSTVCAPVLGNSKIIRYVIKSFSLTLSVTIAVLPINIMFFKRLSIIAPVSNILLMLPITLMIVLALISSVLYLVGIPKVIVVPLLAVIRLIVNYVIKVSEFLANIPMSYISLEYRFLSLWVSLVLILIGLCLIFGKIKRQIKLIVLLSLNMLFTGIISYQWVNRNLTTMNILDVGNGCSVVLSKNGRGAIISCGGDDYHSEKLKNYLDSINCNDLDLILLPSFEKESSLFFEDIENKCKNGTIVLPNISDDNYGIIRNLDNNRLVKFDGKIDIKIWNNIKIREYMIQGKPWILLNIDDINVLMCPCGGNVNDIPRSWSNCDIFLAGGLPMNSKLVRPVYNILSGDKEFCQNNLGKLYGKVLANYVTSGYGSLGVDIKSPNIIAIRREV